MKKLNVIFAATIMLFATETIQTKESIETNLVKDFEKVKSDVSTGVKDEVKRVKDDWDIVIDHIEKALEHAKTIKTAQSNISQHKATALEAQKQISDHVSDGKTKKTLNDYASISKSADNKIDSQQSKAIKMSENLHKHMKDSVEMAKKNHTDIFKAHDEVQRALVKEDKANKNNTDSTKAKKRKSKR